MASAGGYFFFFLSLSPLSLSLVWPTISTSTFTPAALAILTTPTYLPTIILALATLHSRLFPFANVQKEKRSRGKMINQRRGWVITWGASMHLFSSFVSSVFETAWSDEPGERKKGGDLIRCFVRFFDPSTQFAVPLIYWLVQGDLITRILTARPAQR